MIFAKKLNKLKKLFFFLSLNKKKIKKKNISKKIFADVELLKKSFKIIIFYYIDMEKFPSLHCGCLYMISISLSIYGITIVV